MADKKEVGLGWGLAEKARKLIKGDKDKTEERLRQIMEDGETPNDIRPVDSEHAQERRESVHGE